MPLNRRQFLASLALLAPGLWLRPLQAADSRTAIVFDPLFLRHDRPGHPEGAHRLQAVMDELQRRDLLRQVARVPARRISNAELRRAHTAAHIEDIRIQSAGEPGFLSAYSRDTYLNRFTWEAALAAAGGVTDLALAVADGSYRNGFALVRPPGHHAEPDRAMGFCFFGNVALAALALKARGLERIAIIDFDIHHGNGTQAIVGDDPDILFFSLHQRNLFPLGSGRIDDIGEGAGRGSVINAPLPERVDDAGLTALFDEIVQPALERFRPDFILVSAGYDGHWRDPLSNQAISLRGFDAIGRRLIDAADDLCRGRLVFSLEGGYDPEALGHGVADNLQALLGKAPAPDPIGRAPGEMADIAPLLARLKRLHQL